jgi:hypothetical protein
MALLNPRGASSDIIAHGLPCLMRRTAVPSVENFKFHLCDSGVRQTILRRVPFGDGRAAKLHTVSRNGMIGMPQT